MGGKLGPPAFAVCSFACQFVAGQDAASALELKTSWLDYFHVRQLRYFPLIKELSLFHFADGMPDMRIVMSFSVHLFSSSNYSPCKCISRQ